MFRNNSGFPRQSNKNIVFFFICMKETSLLKIAMVSSLSGLLVLFFALEFLG
jgi:nicotinamide riboside transporter PnuC